MTTARDGLTIVHSSDLHIDDGYTMRAWGGDGNGPLVAVIDAARTAGADLLLLTGDVFEHNRLADDILARTAALLRDAGLPVVMLPGNHDPLIRGSAWLRGRLTGIDNVRVLGHAGDTAVFPGWDLEIWGRAHTDYDDMDPLAGAPKRSAAYHVVAGHGHFVDTRTPQGRPGPAWQITPDEIEATGADYVALGHWNVRSDVGSGAVPAHYSGAPDYAETVNIVRIAKDGVSVGQAAVRTPSG